MVYLHMPVANKGEGVTVIRCRGRGKTVRGVALWSEEGKRSECDGPTVFVRKLCSDNEQENESTGK